MALYDGPDKLETLNEAVKDHIIEVGDHKNYELLTESAYVIAGPEYLKKARLNKDRGIRQRLLSNSLSTNDVAAAHAKYAITYDKFRTF